MTSIAGVHLPKAGTDTWLTPLFILDALGHFDLDPCAAPEPRPWSTADHHITFPDDGLAAPWFGRVWMNPPYGKQTGPWLAKLADHGRGLALVFARTETAMFFEHVWEAATAVLFLRGRLTFLDRTGKPAPANSGGPSCLIAYGEADAHVLERCTLAGQFIRLRPRPSAGSSLPASD